MTKFLRWSVYAVCLSFLAGLMAAGSAGVEFQPYGVVVLLIGCVLSVGLLIVDGFMAEE